MLKIENIKTSYGKIDVLWGISLEVDQNEIVALVGANGAGKTTLLHTITGLTPPNSGSISFLDTRIEKLAPHRIVRLGISLVPEGGKPFPEMSVLENLEIGAYMYETWKNREESLAKVYRMFPVLKERTHQLAKTLSGGERQMLAMARSLMTQPKLCLFDEPSYGLAPIIVRQLFDFIRSLRDEGITVLIVEQNVQHALEVADRAYVLENGRIVLDGKSRELLANEHVKKAYLGI
jgi:branched-chain amino acid transport system ATP-binding protein